MIRRTLLTLGTTAALAAAPFAAQAEAAPATTAAARPIVSTRDAAFTTPSGNITCLMSPAGGGRTSVRCEIAHHTWTIKRPKNCELDYGNGLTLYGRLRGQVLCAGDTIYGTSALKDGQTSWYRPGRDSVVRMNGMRLAGLRYGSSLKVGNTTCTSKTAGVTCTNTARHGFTLARDSFRTW